MIKKCKTIWISIITPLFNEENYLKSFLSARYDGVDSGLLIDAVAQVPVSGLPVGGYIVPINKLAILAPYLALIAIMIISVVLVIKRRYE